MDDSFDVEYTVHGSAFRFDNALVQACMAEKVRALMGEVWTLVVDIAIVGVAIKSHPLDHCLSSPFCFFIKYLSEIRCSDVKMIRDIPIVP